MLVSKSGWKFPVGCSVKHVKSGNVYGIVGVGHNEEDMQEVYVYGNSFSSLWVRDKKLMEDGRFEMMESICE